MRVFLNSTRLDSPENFSPVADLLLGDGLSLISMTCLVRSTTLLWWVLLHIYNMHMKCGAFRNANRMLMNVKRETRFRVTLSCQVLSLQEWREKQFDATRKLLLQEEPQSWQSYAIVCSPAFSSLRLSRQPTDLCGSIDECECSNLFCTRHKIWSWSMPYYMVMERFWPKKKKRLLYHQPHNTCCAEISHFAYSVNNLLMRLRKIKRIPYTTISITQKEWRRLMLALEKLNLMDQKKRSQGD